MKQPKASHLIVIFLVLAMICACFAKADEENKTSEEENVQAPKEKRPFCNAFAGTRKSSFKK